MAGTTSCHARVDIVSLQGRHRRGRGNILSYVLIALCVCIVSFRGRHGVMPGTTSCHARDDMLTCCHAAYDNVLCSNDRNVGQASLVGPCRSCVGQSRRVQLIDVARVVCCGDSRPWRETYGPAISYLCSYFNYRKSCVFEPRCWRRCCLREGA